MSEKRLQKRDEISDEYKWKLEDMYETDELWEAECEKASQLAEKLEDSFAIRAGETGVPSSSVTLHSDRFIFSLNFVKFSVESAIEPRYCAASSANPLSTACRSMERSICAVSTPSIISSPVISWLA